MAAQNDNSFIMTAVRVAALFLILLHTYIYYYDWWQLQGLTRPEVGRFLQRFQHTLYFRSYAVSYAVPLVVLAVGSIGDKGKKSENLTYRQVTITLVVGLLVYGASMIAFSIEDLQTAGSIYLGCLATGWAILGAGLVNLRRVLDWNPSDDIFGDKNRSFPQEERLIENQYSINLPTRYRLKNKVRQGWINVVNPFRGTIITGTPGSGKSFAFIKPFIRQMIGKGYTMYVYDFKFPELTTETYNALLSNVDKYTVPPSFYMINFDDLSRSHRCNPLHPDLLHDITDATESAKTMLLNLNRNWITKQGDFFVESPVNFFTAVIWFLRLYENGKYCTLPHAIEFISRDYDEMFPILASHPQIATLVKPFYSAYKSGATDQLEGQIASARIPLSRLASPSLYWVLTGNDFTLDLNNPKEPKVVCLGNNPDRQDIYGAALGLFNSRISRLINKPGNLPSAMIIDELATIYFRGLDNLIATGRSNKVAVVLAFQDMTQLIRDYGDKVAHSIFNICANVFTGQVVGTTAKDLAERFGKTEQVRRGYSQNRMDTSFSHSMVLQERIPSSRIASLSQGEFVGTVADTRQQPIELKTFDAEVRLDEAAIARESKKHLPIPYIRDVSESEVLANFNQISSDIDYIVEMELARIS
ncbi:hypothetical protein LEM8419_03482 [Neolewinella maritima]|uniref:Conjugal transfer protein TraG n=1 Tax=Neolewinella maritima TaxID=1383882 RepID=A0ABN8FF29_9BACT|nr:YWFCY domain-containing protein [Neolewinella maritima]CAH1002610.1 hypothetical protein LEM8419_03482 [Neolewinella maritima]